MPMSVKLRKSGYKEVIMMSGSLYYVCYLPYWTDGKITRRAYNVDKEHKTCVVVIDNTKTIVDWHHGPSIK